MDRETKTRPRLILFTPPVGTTEKLAPLIGAGIKAADIASVILRAGTASDKTIVTAVEALSAPVQKSGAALLLEGHAELAIKSAADGAHFSGIDAFEAAVKLLKPARIAGAGMLTTRHDAMTAGERGADYLMFGEPDATGKRSSRDAIAERITWWAQIFEIPCVGFATTMDEVGEFARAGADFIALDELWHGYREPVEALRNISAQLQTETAA